MGGNVLTYEGVGALTATRVLPFRLTQKIIHREKVGRIFAWTKLKWTWIVGWGSDNLAVVLYVTPRSGKKRFFVNGSFTVEDASHGHYRFETIVYDQRTHASNPPLCVAITVDGGYKADLWLDGINVKSLVRRLLNC